MPPFSPTNTLPPGAKAIAVGRVSPPNTRLSANPAGTAAAAAGDVGAVDLVARPRTSPRSPGLGPADAGTAGSNAMTTTMARMATERAHRMTATGIPPRSAGADSIYI